MEDGEAEALAARIRRQGWRQGSRLPGRNDLFLANLRAPVTPEARELRAKHGDQPTAIVHAELPDEPAMIIVSQDCDLVADPRREPLVEAIPVLRSGEEDRLPAANSARYFTIDPEERLVADLTRKLSFEKSMLPDRDAEHYFEPGTPAESFRAWCARRYARAPLPDDFNVVVGGALDRAWKKGTRTTDPRAQAMYSWRVVMSESAGGVDVEFLVPFDDEAAAKDPVQDLLDELITDAKTRLPAQRKWALRRYGNQMDIRHFVISGAVAKPSAEVSLRALLLFPPLALEHLTYPGDEIIGAEPHSEQMT